MSCSASGVETNWKTKLKLWPNEKWYMVYGWIWLNIWLKFYDWIWLNICDSKFKRIPFSRRSSRRFARMVEGWVDFGRNIFNKSFCFLKFNFLYEPKLQSLFASMVEGWIGWGWVTLNFQNMQQWIFRFSFLKLSWLND